MTIRDETGRDIRGDCFVVRCEQCKFTEVHDANILRARQRAAKHARTQRTHTTVCLNMTTLRVAGSYWHPANNTVDNEIPF